VEQADRGQLVARLERVQSIAAWSSSAPIRIAS
jgi:hypothetical protein